MSAVVIDEPVDRETSEAGREHGHPRVVVDLHAGTGLDAAGLAVLLDARRMLHAQAGGTLILRTNAIVCRALKNTGTIAAFALSNGSGM